MKDTSSTKGEKRRRIVKKGVCGELFGNSTQDAPIILDDNELSILSYAEEFPENWKKICEASDKDTSQSKELGGKKDE